MDENRIEVKNVIYPLYKSAILVSLLLLGNVCVSKRAFHNDKIVVIEETSGYTQLSNGALLEVINKVETHLMEYCNANQQAEDDIKILNELRKKLYEKKHKAQKKDCIRSSLKAAGCLSLYTASYYLVEVICFVFGFYTEQVLFFGAAACCLLSFPCVLSSPIIGRQIGAQAFYSEPASLEDIDTINRITKKYNIDIQLNDYE